MKRDVNFYEFCDAFEKKGRGSQFSVKGKKALYDYLEETYPDYNLDVIELCCSFTEYTSINEVKEAYNLENITSIKDLENADMFGALIIFDGGLLVEN